MLTIFIPKNEFYDSINNEFIYTKEFHLKLEHSLLSISKWESIHHKGFLSNREKSSDEVISYIQCMTLNTDTPEYVYSLLTNSDYEAINNYINDRMSATYFPEEPPNRRSGSTRQQAITSELIYYWMIAYQIPFSCEKWHINRLLALIRVCEIKNDTSKPKTPFNKMAKSRSALNAQRRAMRGTRG